MQYFSLSEFIFSEVAIRKGIDNTPPPEVVKNIELLVKHILDPLRERIGLPIHINSGYRCVALNKAVKGAKNSQHIQGQAADITVKGMPPNELYERIKGMALPYGQCIREFSSWVHISYDGGARHENLIAEKVNGKTVYTVDA